jgi:hypothetical protein
MALPFVGGPLNGQSETNKMWLVWDSDGCGLVWRQYVVEDEPVLPRNRPMPAIGSYLLIKHHYILKCRGEFLMSNCWLEYAGVVS